MTTKAELIKRAKNLQKEILILRNDIESMEEPNPEYGLWKPEVWERYWFINYAGKIEHAKNEGRAIDKFHIEIGNCFKTQEEAEKHLEHLKVETQLRDIAARLNKGRKIDWDDFTQEKVYLSYQSPSNIFQLSNGARKIQGAVVCLDPNFKNVAIAEIGEERLKRFLRSV